ncbi:MAG: hypothetical protein ACFFED_08635 [Candidatus Thorarchaeota archaeon]
MMRKIFGKKKDEDTKDSEESAEEIEEEALDGDSEEAVSESVESEEPITEQTAKGATEPVATAGLTITIPYHATIQDRLKFMLTEGPLAEPIEAPDEFKLELMAMGERFTILKDAMGEVSVTTGTAPDEDVFIRIGNDVVAELLSAANFSEFSTLYLKYYKNAEPGKFVKIELRKPITELNRRGYARVPALKLLIGAARL